MTTRQYARLVGKWIAGIGLDPHVFGTHSLRRTKATLIYRRTGNLRAVQLLLATRGWKVPSDISESRSMTRSPSQNRWKSETSLSQSDRPAAPVADRGGVATQSLLSQATAPVSHGRQVFVSEERIGIMYRGRPSTAYLVCKPLKSDGKIH
jgi:hypothetical protein